MVGVRVRQEEAEAMTHGYGQFCPVAMAAEIVCTRWTLLLLRELCAGASFPTIGFFLNRDHTTVIYGVRRIARELARDEPLRALHARLRRELSATR